MGLRAYIDRKIAPHFHEGGRFKQYYVFYEMFDTMLYSGYRIPPFYDSLLGKLIVHDTDRDGALARLDRALQELRTEGLTTTATLHRRLVQDKSVRAAAFHTGFLEQWLEQNPL